MSGDIVGQDAALSELASALRGGRMPHAWLFAGPRGIGKASLARHFARALLSDSTLTNDEPLAFDGRTARLLEAGAHPDFALLERLEKAGKAGAEARLARGIAIEQVRGLARLLHSASSLGGRRVVMIDAADELEPQAAQALLKNLEEPPAGVIFLLISHVPGRLLATIRSRCRLIKLCRLGNADMATVLGRIAPETSAKERDALLRGANGSPGRAAAMLGLDIAGLEEALAIVARGGESARKEAAKLASTLGSVNARDRLSAFLDLVPARLAHVAQTADVAALGPLLARRDEALRLGEGAVTPLQLEPGALVLALCEQVASEGLGGAAR